MLHAATRSGAEDGLVRRCSRQAGAGQAARRIPGLFSGERGALAERLAYKEAGPQLRLQAFPQRVVNGGGRLKREYGLGRKRTDLLVLWPDVDRDAWVQMSKHVIECKMFREGRELEGTIRDGQRQTEGYMDRCGAETGHLVVFDCRGGRSWDERLFRRTRSTAGCRSWRVGTAGTAPTNGKRRSCRPRASRWPAGRWRRPQQSLRRPRNRRQDGQPGRLALGHASKGS